MHASNKQFARFEHHGIIISGSSKDYADVLQNMPKILIQRHLLSYYIINMALKLKHGKSLLRSRSSLLEADGQSMLRAR